MTEQTEPPKNKYDFSDFKKPSYLITLGIALLSVLLAIYLYKAGNKAKEISYRLNTSALIYDNKMSSPAIKVLEKDSIVLTDNVYLISGLIWNTGDFSISKDDLRKPITVDLIGEGRILDYKIIREIDSSTTKFKLMLSSPKTRTLGWEYFDPNDAMMFQILYTSSYPDNISVNGKVVGIEKFNKIEPNKNNFNPLLAALCAAGSFLFGNIIQTIYLSAKKRLRKGPILTITFIVNIIIVIVLLYLFITLKQQSLPF